LSSPAQSQNACRPRKRRELVARASAELLALKHAVAQGSLHGDGASAAEVSLRLEDGSSYPHKGKLELTDVTVDQNTGAVTLGGNTLTVGNATNNLNSSFAGAVSGSGGSVTS